MKQIPHRVFLDCRNCSKTVGVLHWNATFDDWTIPESECMECWIKRTREKS